MIEFAVYLMIVFVLGYLALIIQSAVKQKRTLPSADEFIEQVAGVATNEQMTHQTRFMPIAKNSHWHRHTFERPRRKVKR